MSLLVQGRWTQRQGLWTLSPGERFTVPQDAVKKEETHQGCDDWGDGKV